MGALPLGVLLVVGACEDAPTPKVEAEAAIPSAAPSPRSDTAPEMSTTPAPKLVVPTCEGRGLQAWACESPKICTAVDPWDEVVTLPEFLCVAQSARTPVGPLRVGDVLADLPVQFRRSFTLKHGTKERGLRGHPQEIMADVVSDALAKRSQSADLDFPRVIMWDDTTGFTISYNGGLSPTRDSIRSQTGADRLDLMGWDPSTSTFEMWALDLPVEPGLEGGWTIAPYQPTHEDDNCTHCHGPRSRPIWPMYPDWPGFYGSDNDELRGDARHQSTEREFLAYFRACVAPGPSEASEFDEDAFDCAPTREAAARRVGARALTDLVDHKRRYDTLFAADIERDLQRRFDQLDGDAVRDYIEGLKKRLGRASARVCSAQGLRAVQGTDEELRAWLGLTMHGTWPYRPDHAEQSTQPSRAFFHRPNLRLGVLYNRLTALNVFAQIEHDTIYREFSGLIALSLMDCGFGDERETQAAALDAFADATRERLKTHALSLGNIRAKGYRIPYPVLLAALDLRVRDVDIRYSYPNRRFDRFDQSKGRKQIITNPMKLGYLSYDDDDFNGVNGASHYWNSYWDGSATFDELLVALILGDLAARSPSYAELYELHTLTTKYERLISRHVLDQPFFARMDALSGWVPLPYPTRLQSIHHRQSFHRVDSGKRPFRSQYAALCTQLRDELSSQTR